MRKLARAVVDRLGERDDLDAEESALLLAAMEYVRDRDREQKGDEP